MRNSQKGETLVEAILALSVAVLIATGIAFAVTTSLSQSNSNQASAYALNLAQQGMSIMNDKAESDFTDFDAYATGYYCLDDEENFNKKGTSTDNSCEDNQTNISINNPNLDFLRTIYISRDGCDRTQGNYANCTGAYAKYQVCSNAAGVDATFVASIVRWTDGKCKTTNCHESVIQSCVTDVNKLPNI